eukprot:11110373-Alexandrium_andersonii.AAC.1
MRAGASLSLPLPLRILLRAAPSGARLASRTGPGRSRLPSQVGTTARTAGPSGQSLVVDPRQARADQRPDARVAAN